MTTLAQDDFTGLGTGDIFGRAPTVSTIGAVWRRRSGTGFDGDGAGRVMAGNDGSAASLDTGNSNIDITVEVTFVGSVSRFTVGAREQSSFGPTSEAGYAVWNIDTTTIRLSWFDSAGARTDYSAVSAGVTFTTGTTYTLRLVIDGTTVKFYVNGTERISQTDSNVTTRPHAMIGGLPIGGNYGDTRYDNLLVTDIAAGTQTLTPSLVTNNQTFYSPTVTGGASAQILAPGLVTNAQTFYAPTVALRGVTAAYVLANTAPVGGNPAGAMYEVAGLVSSGDYLTYTTVSGPTPSGGTLVEYIDGSFDYTGGAPAIWVIQIKVNGVDYFETTTVFLYDQEFTLLPPLLTSAQTFYAPTVSQVGGVQTLSPPRLTNAQTFYAATVGRGAVTLAPPRLNNAQTFYGAAITGGVPSAANGMFTPQMRRRRR